MKGFINHHGYASCNRFIEWHSTIEWQTCFPLHRTLNSWMLKLNMLDQCTMLVFLQFLLWTTCMRQQKTSIIDYSSLYFELSSSKNFFPSLPFLVHFVASGQPAFFDHLSTKQIHFWDTLKPLRIIKSIKINFPKSLFKFHRVFFDFCPFWRFDIIQSLSIFSF